IGTSRYFSIRTETRSRIVLEDGITRNAPRNTNARQFFCAFHGPIRWRVSVNTASVVTMGPRQLSNTSTQSACRFSLRSMSATKAPVSSRSSSATAQSPDQVITVTLAQIRQPTFNAAEQVADAFDGAHVGLGVQELF